MSDFLMVVLKEEPKCAVLNQLLEVEKSWELTQSVSRAASFPSSARFTLDSDFKRSTHFPDSLLNSDRLLVVSERLGEFLSERTNGLERLPIKVDGTDAPYVIAHPVDAPDCLDPASEPVVNKYNPDTIDRVSSFLIDASKVPEGRALFRVRRFWDKIIVTRSLAKEITDAGFTGISFAELSSLNDI